MNFICDFEEKKPFGSEGFLGSVPLRQTNNLLGLLRESDER